MGTVHCFFCGAPGDPGGACRRCQTALPDPRVEVPLTAPCSRCGSRLLVMPFDGGAKIHPCGTCRGLFVPALAWCSLIERPHLAAVLEKRIPPAKMAPGLLVAMVRCPSCNGEMERGRFAASSPIVVDVCTRHGVWLDAGELGEVVDFIAKRARGEAPSEPVGPSGHTFRHGPRVVVVPQPPPSRGIWILRSLVVAIAVAIAARLGVHWYMKKQGAPDISEQGESSAEAAEDATEVLSH